MTGGNGVGLVGGMEMGGTKIVCGVSSDGTSVLRDIRFPTGAQPAVALGNAVSFFTDVQRELGPLERLGVAAFGPCDPNPRSPGYGRITSTPKPGWRGVDVLGALRDGLPGVAMAFDTDVNAAAMGELRHGAGRGLDSLVYLTVGTGIGGGAVVDGRLVHGRAHPEIGHMPIRRPTRDPFAGVCPFHGDCLEGMASGPAIEARWGLPGEQLPADHAAWDLEAEYLGLALATLGFVLAPQRVVLGGGVGMLPHLLDRIGAQMAQAVAGYIAMPGVVNPELGNQAGLIGAFCLTEVIHD